MYKYALLNISKENYNYTNLYVHTNLLYYGEEKRCYQYHSDLIFLRERIC